MNKFIFNMKYKKPYGKRFLSCDTEKYLKFTNEEQANKWANTHYLEWSKKYSKFFGYTGIYSCLDKYMESIYSSDPIRYYCGFPARNLNNFLRKISVPYEDFRNFNDSLVMTLLFSPRIPENIVVYRYVPDIVIQLILESNKEDTWYRDKAFMSCSLLFQPPNNDYFNYENILEIFVDKHTVGTYTNLIEGCRRQEYELLLLRNSEMYLIDYPYKRDNKTIYPVRLVNITDHVEEFDE